MESILQMTENKEITISSILTEISNLTEENNVIIKDIQEYKKELNVIMSNQNNEFLNLSQDEIDAKLNNILDQVLNEEVLNKEVDNNLMVEKKDEKKVETVNEKENDNNSESTIDKNDLEHNSDNFETEIINNENKVQNINILKEETTKIFENPDNFMNISVFSELIKNMDKDKFSEKMDINKMKEELNKMTSVFSNLGINGFGDIFNQMTNIQNFNKNETEDLESFIVDNDNKNLDDKLSDVESYDITDEESSDEESSDEESSDEESSDEESNDEESSEIKKKNTNTENLGNNIFSNFGNLFNLEFLTNKLGLTQNLNNIGAGEDLNDFIDDDDNDDNDYNDEEQELEQESEKAECCTNDNKKLYECLNQNTKMFDELTNIMKGLGLNLNNSETINKKEKKD